MSRSDLSTFLMLFSFPPSFFEGKLLLLRVPTMAIDNSTDIFPNPALSAPSYFQSTYFWIILFLALLVSYRPFNSNRGKELPGLPVAGAHSVFEPEIVTRYRSVTQAWAVVDDGYRKVGSKFPLYL
jgi:hypothetical protein